MRTRNIRSVIGHIVLGGLVVVLLLVSFGGAAAILFVQRTLPQITGSLSIQGLLQPAYVLRDQWGVPRITGDNLHDVIFAEGYVSAQDRLFQMEFNRRVAMGRQKRRKPLL